MSNPIQAIDLAALLSVTGGQTKSNFTQKFSMPSVPWHKGNGTTTKTPTDFFCKPTAQGDKYRDCVPAGSVGNSAAEASPFSIPVGWGKAQ